LVPINAVTKQEQALQLYIRACEQQAERRAIEVCARLAELHQQMNLAAEIRRLPIPVEYLPASEEAGA
jgi:TfoX/Sxy family transcriptional regulator of competence genes